MKVNSKNIEIGCYYKHKLAKDWWFKALEVIKPHTGINTSGKIIVKGEWTPHKNDTMGLIKYFNISDLEKVKEE